MWSRIDISPVGLARGRRDSRTGAPVGRGQLGSGAPLTFVGRRLVRLVLVVAAGLGDALLELLDAKADVAAHGREAAGTEEDHDRDDDPDPFGPWHCSTPSRRDHGPRCNESTAARPLWLLVRRGGGGGGGGPPLVCPGPAVSGGRAGRARPAGRAGTPRAGWRARAAGRPPGQGDGRRILPGRAPGGTLPAL